MTRLLGPALLGVGGIVWGVAITWWWLTFGAITQANTLSLPQAGACLVRGSTICDLAAALCTSRHTFLVAAYNASAFWVAVAAMTGGLILRARPTPPGYRVGLATRRPDRL